MRIGDPKKKSQKLCQKGDKLFKKAKYDKALSKYEAAFALDQDNPEILSKMIEAHDLSNKEWDMEDFTKQVGWTMQQQELDNPRIARLHEKLAPEFEKIFECITRLTNAIDEEAEEKAIDEILSYGDLAVIPLIEFIRSLKRPEEETLEDLLAEDTDD